MRIRIVILVLVVLLILSVAAMYLLENRGVAADQETIALPIVMYHDISRDPAAWGPLQSLPIIGHEWEYLFYVDMTFTDYARYRQSIEAIRPLTRQINILGEYESD